MFQLKRHSGPRKLPENVKNQIVAQLHVEQSQIDQMAYVEKKGTYAGRPVKYIRVLNPALIPNPEKGQLKYDHIKNLDGASLFEVRVEQNGTMYITDMRPGQHKYSTPSTPKA